MGTVYFMPFHISLLSQFLSIMNCVKQFLVICQTLKNCITIYSYSLTPTFVGWARYGTQELYGIPCDTNTPALYLKHVGTNHFQAVKSINMS